MLDIKRWGATGLRRSVALIVTGALLVVGGLALIVHKASTSDRIDPADLSRASKVLQSVQVTMSPSGKLTAVDGNVVGTTTDKKRFTGASTYSPATSSRDLPVRVLTSYRTAKKSGTDLSELDGYDGPVQIQLTVQNLTVKPRTLTYDVDGQQQTRQALVGAPLTVIASTSLKDVAPSAVRRTSADQLQGTNGVLSQSGKGVTQVQWATILAPPQLPTSTTLTLSLDAKDFHVPDFDLSVEPGIVTDPSVGALIDQAFNPSGSDQMQLQKRTIDLVGQVNSVLARAGSTIAQVRSTLDDTSKTLGTKTVTDLTSSASGISNSVKGLDASVKSLGQDISTSLKGTRSATLEQLQQMVQTVDQMLGDTSVKPPKPTVSGNGCQASVGGAKKASSVYSNLLEVVSQLDGYAASTGACKDALRTSILSSVGPAQPDAQTCTDATSVTCSLFSAGTGFKQIATTLLKSGDSAVASLHPEAATDAVAAANTLATAAQQVTTAALAVQGASAGNGADVTDVQHALDGATSAAHDLRTALGDLHAQAAGGQTDEGHLKDLNDSLAGHICDLLTAGTLTQADADSLRAYVTGDTCANTPLVAPSLHGPLKQQIDDQTTAWGDLAHATDLSDSTTDASKALADLDTALTGVGTALDSLRNSSHTDNSNLHTLVQALGTKVTALHTASDNVGTKVGTLKSQQDGLGKAVQKAFGDAAAQTQTETDAAVDPSIRQVTTRVNEDSAALGEMFDRSSAGLSTAARSITKNGAQSVDSQRAAFASRERASGGQIAAAVDGGLAQVTKGVAASVVDMSAADTLLAKDLQSVLLDLGTRKVKGSGLLGSMKTGAATANTAGYQLALASRTATAYANVRKGDVSGLLLRQAQTDAAAKLEAALPAFRLDLPDSASHRTVYAFHVRGEG